VKLALNIASAVFLLTVLAGLVLLGIAVWLLVHRVPSVPGRPGVRRAPTRSVDEAHRALEALKQRYYASHGIAREKLGFDLRRMERRVQLLEQQTEEEQAPYYAAAHRLHEAWREWKAVHDEAVRLHRRERHKAMERFHHAGRRYRAAERDVREQWELAVARDDLALDELRNQGVLKPQTPASPRDTAQEEEETPAQGTPPPPGPVEEPPPQASPPSPEPPAPDAGSEPTPGMAAPAPPVSEGATPPDPAAHLPPLHQADFAQGEPNFPYRRYADETFDLSFTPTGILVAADLTGGVFAGVRFTGLHRHVDGHYAALHLRGATFGTEPRPHQFVRCNLAGADFSGAHLAYMVFSRCDLSRTTWAGTVLNKVKFVACDLTDVDWAQADLHRTVMSPEMLEQTDFSTASALPHNHPARQAPPAPEAEAGAASERPDEQSPPDAQDGDVPAGGSPPSGEPAGPTEADTDEETPPPDAGSRDPRP